MIKSLQPGQLMVKIVYDELVNLMGPVDTKIYFVQPGPTVIMMCGLQGSGKTTTCGKLAMYLKGKGRNPLLAAADLQRPAAIEQLRVLGEQVGVPVYLRHEQGRAARPSRQGAAVAVARAAVNEAKKLGRDVVILDTAGRLAIDDELMDELRDINAAIKPQQIYLVLDAMTGQDAVNSAKAFNEQLELDGLILTKFDSDTRGGALLSAKMVTGKPVKFLGVGEKLDRLEEFRPEGMAQRILGMGDIVGLVSEAMDKFDQEETAKLQAKMEKGEFTLDDFMAPDGAGEEARADGQGDGNDPGHERADQADRPGRGRRRSADAPDAGNLRLDESQGAARIPTCSMRRAADASRAAPAWRFSEVGQFMKQFNMSRDMMRAVGGMGMMGKAQADEEPDERQPRRPGLARRADDPNQKVRLAGAEGPEQEKEAAIAPWCALESSLEN